MSCEQNKDRLYDRCERCHSEVPYKHKTCIACKAELLRIVVDYQDKTGEDMTLFADYILYEAL